MTLSSPYKKDFPDLEGKTWLNAASEGPLPIVAQKELEEAVRWKSRPFELTNEKFIQIPLRLKQAVAGLIHAEARDVILANSASYGLHLLANGLPWRAGDEIIVMENDFPTDILPWLGLEQKGVRTRQLKPRDKVLSPPEIEEAITPATRLVCLTHVHTFTGVTLDIPAMAVICRRHNVWCVVNISQSLGSMPVDVTQLGVDAVVCAGYKWLCGPYGTGFCWMTPRLREQLDYNQAYWISVLNEEQLQKHGPLNLPRLTSARKYDVFGTANFFNFVPFKAALEYWLAVGMETVRGYHDKLLDMMIESLDDGPFRLISPRNGPARSSLLVFSHAEPQRNARIHERLRQHDVYTALWKGNIRISAHVYNDQQDVERLRKYLERCVGDG